MADTIGLVCANGACTAVTPEIALAFIAFESLFKELSKDEAFGPNNEITKIIKGAIDGVTGTSDTNEITKIFRTAMNDIKNGWGENNDVKKFFRELGLIL